MRSACFDHCHVSTINNVMYTCFGMVVISDERCVQHVYTVVMCTQVLTMLDDEL